MLTILQTPVNSLQVFLLLAGGFVLVMIVYKKVNQPFFIKSIGNRGLELMKSAHFLLRYNDSRITSRLSLIKFFGIFHP